ncbi:MAG: tetratricopeptide repeat protein [Pirellulaceae bacterium]|nr:tetratricopeptide repeat protein [Pirellulaceae bacterium]
MSRKQRERRDAAASHKTTSSKLVRRLVPVLLGLAWLALGVNVYWWLLRPQLEPLPIVESEGLEPQVKALIQGAIAEVIANDFSAIAWGDLAAVLRAHDLAAPADACYRNAERLDNSDYRWPYLLGVSLAPTDAEQALDCFRRAAERCGNKPHVQLRLAEMLIERRLMSEAAGLVETVLAHAPSNPRGQLAKARLLFAEGKMDEAKSWAEKSAAGAQDRRSPHLLLAQLCRRTGDKEGEARELALLEKIPDGITPWEDPDVAAVLALRQDQAARLAKAESAAQILAEGSGAEDGSAALQLARAYYQQKDFAAAETVLRTMLKKLPGDERLHFEVGAACFQQRKYQEAAREFSRAIELKSDHVDAHYNLGQTLLRLGKKKEAREAFAAEVQLRPSHALARIHLADLLLQAGETKAAREHLEIAVKLAPQERRVRELLEKARRPNKP